MKSKKAVFFLLFSLISCALATLLVHKFDLLGQQPKSWSPEEELAIKLLKGHKNCMLTAGLKLDLEPTEHINQYKIKSLEGLSSDLKKQLNEGDLIMGPQLINSGKTIGESQTLTVMDPKIGTSKTVIYTVQPIIDCK